MSRARLVLTLRLGAVAAALSPSSAHAGWYYVQSCHPDGVAPGWVPTDAAHTAAYIDCSSSSTSAGLRARNVIDGKYAPGFSAAAVSIGAPPGTYFDWMSFDADLTADLGWAAGVYDFQNRRWAWCGGSCFTLVRLAAIRGPAEHDQRRRHAHLRRVEVRPEHEGLRLPRTPQRDAAGPGSGRADASAARRRAALRAVG